MHASRFLPITRSSVSVTTSQNVGTLWMAYGASSICVVVCTTLVDPLESLDDNDLADAYGAKHV